MGIPEGITVKQARRHLKAENKKHTSKFVLLPAGEVAAVNVRQGSAVERVHRSNRYLVQEYARDESGMVRLTIQRTWCDDDGEWSDGITWDQMQGVKKGLGFGDYCAVEIFPPDNDLVNVASLRHLWVYPEGEHPAFMWKRGE